MNSTKQQDVGGGLLLTLKGWFENVIGTAFNDLINGNKFDNEISGLGGDDTINGGAGNDTLLGGQGDDTLNGEAGDDLLEGGAGRDALDGGDGYDTAMNHQKKDTIVNIELVIPEPEVPAPAAAAPAEQHFTYWIYEGFDSLPLGPFGGYAGWSAASNAFQIIRKPANLLPFTGTIENPDSQGEAEERVLEVKADEGTSVEMSKTLPLLTSGKHTLLFNIRLSDTSKDNVAALALGTHNGAWSKKFQLVFGSSLRLLTSQASELVLLDALFADEWYAVQIDLDLDLGLMTIRVNGELLAQAVQLPTGAISSLDLLAFDGAGSAAFDDIIFIGQQN